MLNREFLEFCADVTASHDEFRANQNATIDVLREGIDASKQSSADAVGGLLANRLALRRADVTTAHPVPCADSVGQSSASVDALDFAVEAPFIKPPKAHALPPKARPPPVLAGATWGLLGRGTVPLPTYRPARTQAIG